MMAGLRMRYFQAYARFKAVKEKKSVCEEIAEGMSTEKLLVAQPPVNVSQHHVS
jgi:hypothetical protein